MQRVGASGGGIDDLNSGISVASPGIAKQRAGGIVKARWHGLSPSRVEEPVLLQKHNTPDRITVQECPNCLRLWRWQLAKHPEEHGAGNNMLMTAPRAPSAGPSSRELSPCGATPIAATHVLAVHPGPCPADGVHDAIHRPRRKTRSHRDRQIACSFIEIGAFSRHASSTQPRPPVHDARVGAG